MNPIDSLSEGLEDFKLLMDKVDWLSNLPEPLIFEVLLNLPTKDVVKTSVLSTRWKNLWRYVPGLDLLCHSDFRDHNAYVRFVDRFLNFNNESYLHSFKLRYDDPEEIFPDIDNVLRWIDTVVERKVQHLHVLDFLCTDQVVLPPILYTCESLVSLKLEGLVLTSPKFVSLPCLKVLDLNFVEFVDDGQLERLISQCPLLESLTIHWWRSCGKKKVLRVCCQYLLNFTYVACGCTNLTEDDLAVVIDAPMLKYLSLDDSRIASFILNNLASLLKVDIDIDFNLCYHLGRKFDPNDLIKRNMIRSFLSGVSCVKDMVISKRTFDIIYEYSRSERLPLFSNITRLRIAFNRWEMLPVFLESCPNLKSLVLAYPYYLKEGAVITFEPRRFLSSLEYVEIERLFKIEATEMKLVSYLLKNSSILKKLTLYLGKSINNVHSVIFKELLSIPRLSSSCEVVVL